MANKAKIWSLTREEVDDLNGHKHLGHDVWWKALIEAGSDNDAVAKVVERLEREPELIEERTRMGQGLLQWSALTAGDVAGIPLRARAVRNHLIKHLPHKNLNAGCQQSDGKDSPYEGLTLLHIIIAQRDADALKALLARGPGLDLKVQATGSFFKELVSEAAMYYGEYPLSFAVSIGWIEGMELLDQYAEADGGWNEGGFTKLVTMPDSFGNTALHMAVRHNRRDSYDWLRAHALIDVSRMNRMGLTVVTMAVMHNDGDMFDHVFNSLYKVKWQMGHVTTFSLLLDQVDTVPLDASFPKFRTVLELALLNRINKVMTNPLIKAMLDAKWNNFAKPLFALSCIAHVAYLYFLSSTTYEYSKQEELESNAPINSALNEAEIVVFVMTLVFLMGTCLDLTTTVLHKKNRYRILEAAERGFQDCISNCVLEAVERGFQDDVRRAKLLSSGNGIIASSRGLTQLPVSVYDVVGWIGQFFLTAHFIAFQVGGKGVEATALLSLGTLFTWQSTMSLLLPWRHFGRLVIVVINVIKEDISTFVVLLTIALAGFSQAVRVLEVDPHGFHNGIYGMLTFFRMTMGEKPAWTRYSASNIGDLQDLAVAYFVIFVLLSAIALLRLLISMFNGTYQETMKTVEGTWRLQWGSMMLRLERRLLLCVPKKLCQRFLVLDNPSEPGHSYVFRQVGDGNLIVKDGSEHTAIVDALQEQLVTRGLTIQNLQDQLKAKEHEVASLRSSMKDVMSKGEAVVSVGADAVDQVRSAALSVPGTVIEETGNFLGKGVHCCTSALGGAASLVHMRLDAAERQETG